MKNIRIGNDINIVWAIYDVTGAAYELKKEMKLTLKCGNYLYEIENYTVEDNKIMFTFYGKTQTTVGTYMLTLVENDDEVGMQTVDCCKAFKLVRTSCEQTDDDTLNPQVDTLQLTSNIDFYGVMGGNAPIMTTYKELMTLYSNNELVEGQQYRFPYTLIGYADISEYWDNLGSFTSRKKFFDLIVTATSSSTFSYKCKAAFNADDDYFKNNCNIGAWDIWWMPSYEYFNPTHADENAEYYGWIFKMVDEFGNEAPYDFKNLLWIVLGSTKNSDGRLYLNYSEWFGDPQNQDEGLEAYLVPTFYKLTDDIEIFDVTVGQQRWDDDTVECYNNKILGVVKDETYPIICNNCNNNILYYGDVTSLVNAYNVTMENHNNIFGYNISNIKLGSNNILIMFFCYNCNIIDDNVLFLSSCDYCNIGYDNQLVIGGLINGNVGISNYICHNVRPFHLDSEIIYNDGFLQYIINCQNLTIADDNNLATENTEFNIADCSDFIMGNGNRFENDTYFEDCHMKIGNYNTFGRDYLSMSFNFGSGCTINIGNYNEFTMDMHYSDTTLIVGEGNIIYDNEEEITHYINNCNIVIGSDNELLVELKWYDDRVNDVYVKIGDNNHLDLGILYDNFTVGDNNNIQIFCSTIDSDGNVKTKNIHFGNNNKFTQTHEQIEIVNLTVNNNNDIKMGDFGDTISNITFDNDNKIEFKELPQVFSNFYFNNTRYGSNYKLDFYGDTDTNAIFEIISKNNSNKLRLSDYTDVNAVKVIITHNKWGYIPAQS